MTVVHDGLHTSRERGGGLQVSLGGLIVLVLAAGLASGVARSAREVWGTRMLDSNVAPGVGPGARSSPVPLERTAGLALEVADVFLMAIVARGLIARFRGFRSAETHEKRGRYWSIVWRVGALCFLLWFLSEESRVLRVDISSMVARSRRASGVGLRYEVWQGLFPVCGLMAILGLALGMGAGFLLPGSSKVRHRPYWLFVFLAAVVAVLLVAIPSNTSLIPYLILIALEAVTNAMQNRMINGPGLSTRLIHAGIEASVAGAACLALALAVARDFERLRRGQPWMTTRVGRVVRIVLLVATAAGGLTISMVTIPGIHPCFAQGFGEVITPIDIAMIVSGFGLLAAGLAARSVVGPRAGHPPVWRTRLSAGVGIGFLGLIFLYAVRNFPTVSELDPTFPPFVSNTIAFCQGILANSWNKVPDTVTIAVDTWFAADVFPWALMAVVIVVLLLELAIRGASAIHAPFDRLAESPGRARPFVWLVLGLTLVCLSALPILIVAGQVVLHLRMHGTQVLAGHWAN